MIFGKRRLRFPSIARGGRVRTLRRKCATTILRNGSAFTAVEDGDVAGFCTLTEKDELPALHA